eukprot:30825-Pelagococcus_subviridis.AAC.9
MRSIAPPVDGRTVDTAATDPAPTPTAACAATEPTIRKPERTVSMAAAGSLGVTEVLRGAEIPS